MNIDEKNSELRIVWYRAIPLRHFGGLQRLLVEGIRCFREMGANVTLVLNEPILPEFESFYNSCKPDILVLPGFFPVQTKPWPWARAARYFRRVRILRKILRALSPDFIVVNEPQEAQILWLYSLGGLLYLPPLITFVHGSPFQFDYDLTKYALAFRRQLVGIRANDPVYRTVISARPPSMSLKQRLQLEFYSFMLRFAVRRSAQVLVLSQKNWHEVKLLYGCPNIEVLCPGGYGCNDLDLIVQREAPALPTGIGRPVLLSLCRLDAKKRVDLILRAFRAFLNRNPGSPATLVVGGTGPAESALQKLTNELELKDRVIYLGFVPESKLSYWYAACDVFLSADNADYDLSVMSALPFAKKIVVSTQYEIPPGLKYLRRFFFAASPDVESFADNIAVALATIVAPLSSEDVEELRPMTWERYFEAILNSIGP